MTGSRNTIYLEDAKILSHEAFDGDQFILRLRAPKSAAAARPGSFAHLRCDDTVPMRRPLSIMRANTYEGSLDLLYKPLGSGLRRLSAAKPGASVSVLAPIGNGFSPDRSRPRVLALGGGVGIPPMLFLAETLAAGDLFQTWVLMGSEVPFPFALTPATAAVKQIGPPAVTKEIQAIADLEARGIASLITSNAGLPGAFPGYVTELGRRILQTLPPAELERTQLAACGPGPMLAATAALAAAFKLPCQLALEEYMACGVGGCAGCTVAVHGPDGLAMRRVCVDGPVFEAGSIYPETG